MEEPEKYLVTFPLGGTSFLDSGDSSSTATFLPAILSACCLSCFFCSICSNCLPCLASTIDDGLVLSSEVRRFSAISLFELLSVDNESLWSFPRG